MPTSTLLPTPPADREQLLWLTPSPLWSDMVPTTVPAFDRPHLVEFDTDDFIPAFLGLLAGEQGGPSSLSTYGPTKGDGTTSDPFVLFRPLHLRYYLVVGSLVCRQIGLPDRAVVPRAHGVTFVVRRVRASGEDAWLPDAGKWVATSDPESLVSGEEQHPMQSETINAPSGSGPAAELLGLDEAGCRGLHYGYIPVAAPSAQSQPLADPLSALDADPARSAGDDPRLMDFRQRIAGPWADVGAQHALGLGIDIAEPSLYILLDLRDWLGRYLPSVLDALVSHSTLPVGSPAEAVRNHLDVNLLADGGARNLGTILGDLAGYSSLLEGIGSEPATRYEVHAPPGGLPGFVNQLGGVGESNGGLVLSALTDATQPGSAAQVPPELQDQIVPRAADPAADADQHVIRLVYEHDPCAPVVSKPSAVVRFAGNYDPDAPARPMRIELPDPSQLRRFNRGVAIDMPPSLRRILDSITPKILKEEGLGPEGGWGLGMICSFSIQIIMLVAFIVMFIFLILLNIVFWWLPFLKVCFPVPTKDDP